MKVTEYSHFKKSLQEYVLWEPHQNNLKKVPHSRWHSLISTSSHDGVEGDLSTQLTKSLQKNA